MPILNKIPSLTSGDYKNYNAYFDENPGKSSVQYLLNSKVLITESDGVYRTILGDLTKSLPYADYTSVYVKTFINMPFRKNPLYSVSKGNIDTKSGIVINETPVGENNPDYKAQPTFMVACPGRDTLALDPSTKMLTNTRRVVQGGTSERVNNNNIQQNTNTSNNRTSTRMGSSGGGGGY